MLRSKIEWSSHCRVPFWFTNSMIHILNAICSSKLVDDITKYNVVVLARILANFDDILPKWPYPPCLRMADGSFWQDTLAICIGRLCAGPPLYRMKTCLNGCYVTDDILFLPNGSIDNEPILLLVIIETIVSNTHDDIWHHWGPMCWVRI